MKEGDTFTIPSTGRQPIVGKSVTVVGVCDVETWDSFPHGSKRSQTIVTVELQEDAGYLQRGTLITLMPQDLPDETPK